MAMNDQDCMARFGEHAVAFSERSISTGEGTVAEMTRDEAIAALAECYRLSGADSDGGDDEMLAIHAVSAVSDLRQSDDDAGAEVSALRSEIAALRAERDALAAKVDMWKSLGEAVQAERQEQLAIIAALGIPDAEDQGGHPVPGAGRDTTYALRWAARRIDALASDCAALVAVGERLRAQDNQMTAHPIFVVEHRGDARRPWEFVTACLTDEGARNYMSANGHNLRKFRRIFVHSGYRNDEWIGLRNRLMSLLAHPLQADTPTEDQNAPGVCPSCRVALDAVVRQTRRREGQ